MGDMGAKEKLSSILLYFYFYLKQETEFMK